MHERRDFFSAFFFLLYFLSHSFFLFVSLPFPVSLFFRSHVLTLKLPLLSLSPSLSTLLILHYSLPLKAFDSWTLGMRTTSEFGNAEVSQ